MSVSSSLAASHDSTASHLFTASVFAASPDSDTENISSQWYLQKIGMPPADEIPQPAPDHSAIIAVIDTGILTEHPALQDSLWINDAEKNGEEGIDDDGNGYIDDIYGYNVRSDSGNVTDTDGHGTHIAGIIAMHPTKDDAACGVYQQARIMTVKAANTTNGFSSENLVKAIRYAVTNGADVINLSLGTSYCTDELRDCIQEYSGQTIFVAAAGNGSFPTHETISDAGENIFPAGLSDVIGVMSFDSNEQLAWFSNWDAMPGTDVDYELIAPGEDIYSTTLKKGYKEESGTSMSTAVVSAACGMLIDAWRCAFLDDSDTYSPTTNPKYQNAYPSTTNRKYQNMYAPTTNQKYQKAYAPTTNRKYQNAYSPTTNQKYQNIYSPLMSRKCQELFSPSMIRKCLLGHSGPFVNYTDEDGGLHQFLRLNIQASLEALDLPDPSEASTDFTPDPSAEKTPSSHIETAKPESSPLGTDGSFSSPSRTVKPYASPLETLEPQSFPSETGSSYTVPSETESPLDFSQTVTDTDTNPSPASSPTVTVPISSAAPAATSSNLEYFPDIPDDSLQPSTLSPAGPLAPLPSALSPAAPLTPLPSALSPAAPSTPLPSSDTGAATLPSPAMHTTAPASKTTDSPKTKKKVQLFKKSRPSLKQTVKRKKIILTASMDITLNPDGWYIYKKSPKDGYKRCAVRKGKKLKFTLTRKHSSYYVRAYVTFRGNIILSKKRKWRY